MVYETYGASGVENSVESYQVGAQSSSLFSLTHMAAGVVSLALVAGVGVWGYKLLVRDVNGIPVVQAFQGESRVRPADPGGQVALHQGLSVNAVAAQGGAQAPADRLVLAPQPVELTAEDVPMDPASVAIVQQVVSDVQAAVPETSQIDQDRVVAAAQNGSVDELVAALTQGVAPITPLVAASQAPILDATGAGMRVSLRPKLRPKRVAARQVAPAVVTPAAASAVPSTRDVDASRLPAGTRLVQLGAYDSAAVSKSEWARFSARFGDLMADKGRVIQKASSGGRTFYRLRVMGFADLADARRFCSALLAEGADCIPVVTR